MLECWRAWGRHSCPRCSFKTIQTLWSVVANNVLFAVGYLSVFPRLTLVILNFLKKCENIKIYERRNEKEFKTESTQKNKNKTRKLKREVSKWNVGHILNICLKICYLVHYVYVILWCNSFNGCHSGIHVDKTIMFSAIVTIQTKPITDHFMTNG